MNEPCSHGQAGGDQFCIWCLRKRGDDALLQVAEMVSLLREIEWAGSYHDEPQCVCCSATARYSNTDEEFERSKQPHDSDCRWANAVRNAEALLV